MSDLKRQLDAIADAAPPPGDLRREHEIRRAIEAGLAAPASAPARRIWPWATLGATIAAAAAIVFFLFIRPGAHDLRVEQGSLATPGVGETVEVAQAERVVLRTADDSTVEANALTQFSRTDIAATRWRLERGQLTSHVTKRKAGQTFEVATAEATVVVVGTRFTVDRAITNGVASTRVSVEEGVVRVTPTTGEVVVLHAGEQWPAVQTAANDKATDGSVTNAPTSALDAAMPDEATPADATPGNDAKSNDTKSNDTKSNDTKSNDTKPTDATPARPFDATAIRSIIRAGNLTDARKLIDDGRKAASKKTDLAELGILAAEAELAGRATKQAITLYLAVVRDYPSTPQAEQALFAAAQLAARQPDAGYKAEAILRDYLDAYPKGQFASDAQRLLDGAKK